MLAKKEEKGEIYTSVAHRLPEVDSWVSILQHRLVEINPFLQLTSPLQTKQQGKAILS